MPPKLTIYEWNGNLRKQWPNRRVYDWREVDAMRVQLAKTGAALGIVQPTLTGVLRRIDELREEHRKAKNYGVSDALRDILAGAGVQTKDNCA